MYMWVLFMFFLLCYSSTILESDLGVLSFHGNTMSCFAGCHFFVLDNATCTNTGTDEYGFVSWSCDYALPSHLSVYGDDVVCRGVHYPTDPIVDKESCIYEYAIKKNYAYSQ